MQKITMFGNNIIIMKMLYNQGKFLLPIYKYCKNI